MRHIPTQDTRRHTGYWAIMEQTRFASPDSLRRKTANDLNDLKRVLPSRGGGRPQDHAANGEQPISCVSEHIMFSPAQLKHNSTAGRFQESRKSPPALFVVSTANTLTKQWRRHCQLPEYLFAKAGNSVVGVSLGAQIEGDTASRLVQAFDQTFSLKIWTMPPLGTRLWDARALGFLREQTLL
ncbi:hypothetical protein BDW66DRAFT_154013 [Aspergillus desertorum]